MITKSFSINSKDGGSSPSENVARKQNILDEGPIILVICLKWNLLFELKLTVSNYDAEEYFEIYSVHISLLKGIGTISQV